MHFEVKLKYLRNWINILNFNCILLMYIFHILKYGFWYVQSDKEKILNYIFKRESIFHPTNILVSRAWNAGHNKLCDIPFPFAKLDFLKTADRFKYMWKSAYYYFVCEIQSDLLGKFLKIFLVLNSDKSWISTKAMFKNICFVIGRSNLKILRSLVVELHIHVY